jgi:hypothetical protein
MSRHDDQLPENYEDLLQLARGVTVPAAPVSAPGDEPVPQQRELSISESVGGAAASFREDQLVGFSTHGR